MLASDIEIALIKGYLWFICKYPNIFGRQQVKFTSFGTEPRNPSV